MWCACIVLQLSEVDLLDLSGFVGQLRAKEAGGSCTNSWLQLLLSPMQLLDRLLPSQPRLKLQVPNQVRK